MAALPMFPLGTVLLPGQALPLHVFEPRYRAMMRDIASGDGRLAVVLIRRGHEVGGGDERHDVATAVRIARARELDDGRWVVLAVGTGRVRVTSWLEDDPYPRAEVTELVDVHDDARVSALHDRVAARLRFVLELADELGEPGPGPDVPLDDDPRVACWQDPAVAPLTPLDRQRLLEVDDCARRLELLDELLVGVEEVLTFRLLADG